VGVTPATFLKTHQPREWSRLPVNAVPTVKPGWKISCTSSAPDLLADSKTGYSRAGNRQIQTRFVCRSAANGRAGYRAASIRRYRRWVVTVRNYYSMVSDTVFLPSETEKIIPGYVAIASESTRRR